MADNCLFCKMVSGAIKPDTVYEDDAILAFNDINPQAPVHVLVIPKRHVTTLNDLTDEDALLAGRLLLSAKRIAKDLGIAETGYRVSTSCNREGGQTVYHLHLHVLGGRHLKAPLG